MHHRATETLSPEHERKLVFGERILSLRQIAREIEMDTPTGKEIIQSHIDGAERLLALKLEKQYPEESLEDAIKRIVLQGLGAMVH